MDRQARLDARNRRCQQQQGNMEGEQGQAGQAAGAAQMINLTAAQLQAIVQNAVQQAVMAANQQQQQHQPPRDTGNCRAYAFWAYSETDN